MRQLAVLAMLAMLASPILAQKDKFPLTAKIVSSGEETVPGTGGVSTTSTSPQVRAQFPNVPATHVVRTQPQTYISTTVRIGDKNYVISGGKLMDPGDYPASIDGRTMRLLTTDKRGKPKVLKFHIASVAAVLKAPAS